MVGLDIGLWGSLTTQSGPPSILFSAQMNGSDSLLFFNFVHLLIAYQVELYYILCILIDFSYNCYIRL